MPPKVGETEVTGNLLAGPDDARDPAETPSPWREQRTDDEGRARFNPLRGPSAVLRVTHDRYEAFERELSVDGAARSETVHLRPKSP